MKDTSKEGQVTLLQEVTGVTAGDFSFEVDEETSDKYKKETKEK